MRLLFVGACEDELTFLPLQARQHLLPRLVTNTRRLSHRAALVSGQSSFSPSRSLTPPLALHSKGREKAILEMDLKIDDLLEKVGDGLVVRGIRS